MDETDVSEDIFESTAKNFALITDAQINNGTYRRGYIFADAVKQHVTLKGMVLDYGSGPGRLARLIAEQGFDVVGVDPSHAMIREAQSMLDPSLKLSFSEINDEHIGNNEYDAVVCSSVIEYVPNPRDLLIEFRNRLRVGGHLVISYANKHSLWGIYFRQRYKAQLPHLKRQVNVWTTKEFKCLLEASGLQPISRPVFYEAAPFDKRPAISILSSFFFIGTLGMIVAKKSNSR